MVIVYSGFVSGLVSFGIGVENTSLLNVCFCCSVVGQMCFLLIVCGEMCSIVKCCLLNRAAGSAVAHSVQTNDYLMASATKDIEAPGLEKEAWKRLGPFCMSVFRLCHFGRSVNNV